MNTVGHISNRPGSRSATVFCLLLTLALLFGSLPYRGIRHDGILYLGQALAHLNPHWASNDLFFAHGSQDRFSIFSPIRAWVMTYVGATTVDMTVLFCAWLIWIPALLALTREFSAPVRWFAVLAVIGSSHYYGTTRTFAFLEPFVTARTWAEPVTLIAMAALLRGRLFVAGSAFLLAMLLHPLIALPAMAVAFVYLVSLDRRWLALLLTLIPVIALAYADVAPFAGLLKTYDFEWFQATLLSNNIVYVSNWYLADAVAALAHMGVLWLACRGSDSAFARLGRAAVVSTPILCLMSFVGADLFHNVLITQLQLWRVLWILDLLSLLALSPLLAGEWNRGAKGRCAAVAIFVAIYAIDDWIPTGWLFFCWAVLATVLSFGRAAIKPWVLYLATAVTIFAGFGVIVLQWINAVQQLEMHTQGMKLARPLSIPFALPLIALPVALGLTVGWSRAGVMRGGAMAVVVGLLGISLAYWDQRSPWERYVESAAPGKHPFAALIPADAQVYWHEDTAATWVLLQRANFISSTQTSGLLFNRETALAAVQRVPALLSVMTSELQCAPIEKFAGAERAHDACELPRDRFLGMCKAIPTHPDFLISAVDFGVAVVSRWRFIPDDGSKPVTYVLYDCSKVL